MKEVPFAKQVLLVEVMPSSKSCTRLIASTGPKISSRPTLMSSVTLSKMVGPTKKPFSNPGTTRSRPEDEIRTLCDTLVDPSLHKGLVLGLTTGPSSVLGSYEQPTTRCWANSFM